MTDFPPLPELRAAFEAWLNPGRNAGNISPWVEPGRYEKDTHQFAWLAWVASAAAEREQWERASEAMALEADHKFTMDGTVAHWLRALVKDRQGLRGSPLRGGMPEDKPRPAVFMPYPSVHQSSGSEP